MYFNQVKKKLNDCGFELQYHFGKSKARGISQSGYDVHTPDGEVKRVSSLKAALRITGLSDVQLIEDEQKHPEPEVQEHPEVESQEVVTIDPLALYLDHLGNSDLFSQDKGYSYGYTDGKKYYRVYRDYCGQRSVVSFVDKQTGTIHKAHGWKAPSKTVIGSLEDYLLSRLEPAAAQPEQSVEAETEDEAAGARESVEAKGDEQPEPTLADELAAIAEQCEQALAPSKPQVKQLRPKTPGAKNAGCKGEARERLLGILADGATLDEVQRAMGWTRKSAQNHMTYVKWWGYGLGRKGEIYKLVEGEAKNAS